MIRRGNRQNSGNDGSPARRAWTFRLERPRVRSRTRRFAFVLPFTVAMVGGALGSTAIGGVDGAALALALVVVAVLAIVAWFIAGWTPPASQPAPARTARIEREVGDLLARAIAERSEVTASRERSAAPMRLAPHDERLYRPLTELSEPLSSRLN